MRLVTMATGPFAAPALRVLYDTHHIVLALVTAPVRGQRGSRPEPASPVRDLAHDHQIPIFEPEDINGAESQRRLADYQADLLVVCDYGQILSAATLATARLGGVNLHASLLPKYRGAAPINWAIYHGEAETGVTVIHMSPRVDAGPCIGQARTLIDPEETAVELESRLAEMGGWLLRRTIDSLEAGRIDALPQDPAMASKAPRLRKTNGLIDWQRPAGDIRNQYRAMQPWPKTYTFWHRIDGPPLRLIVGPLHLAPDTHLAPCDSRGADSRASLTTAPGTVLDADGPRLVVATGRGAVAVEGVQPAGKRNLSVEDFLRGYHVQPGDRFGPEQWAAQS